MVYEQLVIDFFYIWKYGRKKLIHYCSNQLMILDEKKFTELKK